jgi:tRNA dimethylallyltransferase
VSNKLIVIQGPTASGKTALAVELALHFKTIVLSADSRQFYQEMAIGTAKPSLAEQKGVKHYFIDSHQIKDQITSAQFEKEALTILENEFKKHGVIILVGGSGMFINALCDGLDDIPSDKDLRDELSDEVKKDGLVALLSELQIKDPEYFAQVDQQNPVRLIRAIEAIRLSGKKYSELRAKSSATRPFAIQKFVIDLPREILYQRINQRVNLMMEKGLLEEVKSLLPYRNLQSLNTVGYSELFAYLDGEIALPEAIDLIKQNTRRYAKRQLTWFRKDDSNHWLKAQTTEEQVSEIIKLSSVGATYP